MFAYLRAAMSPTSEKRNELVRSDSVAGLGLFVPSYDSTEMTVEEPCRVHRQSIDSITVDERYRSRTRVLSLSLASPRRTYSIDSNAWLGPMKISSSVKPSETFDFDEWGITPSRRNTGFEYSEDAMVYSERNRAFSRYRVRGESIQDNGYRLRCDSSTQDIANRYRGDTIHESNRRFRVSTIQESGRRMRGQTLLESTNKIPNEVIQEMVRRRQKSTYNNNYNNNNMAYCTPKSLDSFLELDDSLTDSSPLSSSSSSYRAKRSEDTRSDNKRIPPLILPYHNSIRVNMEGPTMYDHIERTPIKHMGIIPHSYSPHELYDSAPSRRRMTIDIFDCIDETYSDDDDDEEADHRDRDRNRNKVQEEEEEDDKTYVEHNLILCTPEPVPIPVCNCKYHNVNKYRTPQTQYRKAIHSSMEEYNTVSSYHDYQDIDDVIIATANTGNMPYSSSYPRRIGRIYDEEGFYIDDIPAPSPRTPRNESLYHESLLECDSPRSYDIIFHRKLSAAGSDGSLSSPYSLSELRYHNYRQRHHGDVDNSEEREDRRERRRTDRRREGEDGEERRERRERGERRSKRSPRDSDRNRDEESSRSPRSPRSGDRERSSKRREKRESGGSSSSRRSDRPRRSPRDSVQDETTTIEGDSPRSDTTAETSSPRESSKYRHHRSPRSGRNKEGDEVDNGESSDKRRSSRRRHHDDDGSKSPREGDESGRRSSHRRSSDKKLSSSSRSSRRRQQRHRDKVESGQYTSRSNTSDMFDDDLRSRGMLSRQSSRRSDEQIDGLEDLFYCMRNSNVIYVPTDGSIA